MAELKKRILTFSNGKTVKLWGNSIAIGRSLELGEGYAPNLFYYSFIQTGDKSVPAVSNPYGLTKEELLELADFNIRMWMDLKDAIRMYGTNNVKVFNKDAMI